MTLKKGQLLGTITPWTPAKSTPQGHPSLNKVDRDFLREMRHIANLHMYSSDEDTAFGWRNEAGESAKSLSSGSSMQQRDESAMYAEECEQTESPVPQDIVMTTGDNPHLTITATPDRMSHTQPDTNDQNTSVRTDATSTASTTRTTSEKATDSEESSGTDRVWGEKRVETVELNILSAEQQISLKRQTTHSRPNPTKRYKPVFLNVVKVHQSRLERRPSQVATTEMLPHILFPVGDRQPGQSWKTMPTIRALLDTGSGLNIGYGPYWRSVAEQCPTLVREYGKLDDTDCERLTVGGIDKNGEGTACSHFIVLKTPFTEKGREVDLRIALTDGLSCNLIFGLPFIVRARMTINMWEKYVVSTVFHTTFPLHYHPPELRDSIIPQDGTPLTLTAARRQA